MHKAVKREDVQQYYGKVLQSKRDLKTSACCVVESVPEMISSILSKIDSEVLEKFYGCGVLVPPLLEGCTVLDLGCGTGRDAFVLSALVGQSGRVIGVDMTEEQLMVAQKYQTAIAQRLGYSESNIEFKKGYIEELDTLGIADHSMDLVVSNCVFNLSFDKSKLIEEVFRVLKPGGELYFSDVFASRRIPAELKQDPILIGECIAGAFYFEDFRRSVTQSGCPCPFTVFERDLEINDPDILRKLEGTRLESKTIRAFKVNGLEDREEDYGQTATYLGTIPQDSQQFLLDPKTVLKTGVPTRVSGNTASILQETRLAPHFKIDGDQKNHRGLFDSNSTTIPAKGGCC